MREIVTLQLGNLSNYVATHFWNAQESYFTYSDRETSLVDPNIHWRAGLGADGVETFLPRTVVYDLKGGFGSLRQINALYEATEEPQNASLWSGPSTVHKQNSITPSAYQQSLDAGTDPAKLTKSSVRYWSDFSRVFYHPKSLVQLYDFELNSSIMPFERFSMGTELFQSLEKEHDMVDRDWRPFVEECDQMQGINVFTSLDDAWGGFATSYLEALRDEYPKACIWTWGVQSPTSGLSREKRLLRLSNTAQTLSQACAQATTVIPISLPRRGLPSGVEVDPKSPWEVSALFSSAMESASLPSRLAAGPQGGSVTMQDMSEALNPGGNQALTNLNMSFGQDKMGSEKEEEALDIDFSALGESTPGRRSGRLPKTFTRLSTIRSEAEKDAAREPQVSQPQRPMIGEAVFRDYRTTLEYPLLSSYPSIYTDPDSAERISIRTNLTTDSSVVEKIRRLRSQATWSIGVDERESLASDLADLADAYQGDWSEGSDEDYDSS